jgi:hypothetical protein
MASDTTILNKAFALRPLEHIGRIARRTDLAPPEPSGRYLTDAEMAEFNALMADRENGYQTGIALGQRRR